MTVFLLSITQIDFWYLYLYVLIIRVPTAQVGATQLPIQTKKNADIASERTLIWTVQIMFNINGRSIPQSEFPIE